MQDATMQNGVRRDAAKPPFVNVKRVSEFEGPSWLAAQPPAMLDSSLGISTRKGVFSPMEMSRCPNPGPLLIRKNKDTFKAELFRPPCKQWNCPYCGPMLAKEWAFVAWHGTRKFQNEGVKVVFATITSHEKLTQKTSMDVWPSAWKKLRQRIVREYGPMQYFMVSEQHRSGVLHMHALVTAEMRLTWLKTAARGCGLGYMADVKPVDQSIAAAFYVSKYLGKFGLVWPKGWRRVRISQDWPREIIDTPEDDTQVTMLGSVLTRREILAQVAGYESIGFDVYVSPSCFDGLIEVE